MATRATSIESAVRKALAAAPLRDVDEAAAALARMQAATIDAGGVDELRQLAPQFLATLESLGLTPRSRRALVNNDKGRKPVSPLDELRERRERRRAAE